MAIGLGKVFGFEFSENFNYPYVSKSVTEFWRRWHISLSTWFRDYIYIPLGGNRVKPFRQIMNMLVVWGLTGLWHGASWNFVLWGLYYFVWLVLEKYVLKDILNYIPAGIRWLTTMLIVVFGWVLFRAADLEAAMLYMKAMTGQGYLRHSMQDVLRFLINYAPFWFVGAIFAAPWIKNLYYGTCKKCGNHTLFLIFKKLVILLLLLLCCLYIIASSYNAFIYFQF